MSAVVDVGEAVPCSECGARDVLTVGPPGAALCEVCWNTRRLEPEEARFVLQGLRTGCRACMDLVGVVHG